MKTSGILLAGHGYPVKEKNEALKFDALLDIASTDITLEFDVVLQEILKIICNALNAHSGTMMLADGETGLRMAASHGLGRDFIEKVDQVSRSAGMHLDSGPQGTVLRDEKCRFVPNIIDEQEAFPWHDLSMELGYSSMILAPMKKGACITGVLTVQWAKQRQLTNEEICFLKEAAAHAAIVVQNAKMSAGLKDEIKAIRDSEAKYRNLFENINDCFYIHDAEGNFKDVNNAALNLLGCTKEDIIGTNISQWLTPESITAVANAMKEGLGGGPGEQQMILNVICKNGDIRLMEIRRRLVREDNRITEIYGVGRDITEKTKLEQQLRDYNEKLSRSCEELIEMDRAKTEFISNVSHELLTPLTSIKGFTELLLDQTSGIDNENQMRKLEIIFRNSERLIGLIRELIEISHLEKNKFGLNFGLVSMNEVIKRSIQDIYPQARQKEISIIPDIKRLPRIWGDEDRLNHVITNLLSNAIKFTPPKGTVTITAGEDTKEIRIKVTDTGIGIQEDKLKRIFDKFYQIDASSNRKYGGAGLGLSLCKSIIENHYGSIWAESTGSGSTFNIVLPKLEHMKKNG